MSVRNFWSIFLKILGIWLVVGGWGILMQFVSAFSFMANGGLTLWNVLLTTALLFLTIGAYIFVLWLFVFKTAWLIDKLQLEKGFDEEKIEFNVSTTSVITIATIVIGGLMVADSLPDFCRQVYSYIQNRQLFIENSVSGWIVLHFVKMIIGYLLMTKSKVVVKFIEKQNKGTE